MYVKKSSTKSSSISNGQIDSALRTAWEEKLANVAATLFGDVGESNPPLPPPLSVGESNPNLRFLIASACRFGGPRRRLGRFRVHGISRAAQALQGGPDSSHYVTDRSALSLSRPHHHGMTYLYFSDTTRIACFP